jgi:flagellin FlaB
LNTEVFAKEGAFTGLEAAIVLIAFVVVAAVFSYVVLGAGFFASHKSQAVVHTAVGQASSSVQVSGSIIGKADNAGQQMDLVIFFLQTSAGGTPVDMDSVSYVVTNQDRIITLVSSDVFLSWTGGDDDGLLEKGEFARVDVPVSSVHIYPEDEFSISIRPANRGASYTIVRIAPPSFQANGYYEL